MLNHLIFKFGSNSSEPELELSMEPSVTVFVGPNNSGKSLALKELYDHFRNGSNTEYNKIIKKIKFQNLSQSEISDLLLKIKRPAFPNENINNDHSPVNINGNNILINESAFHSILSNTESNIHYHCVNYVSHFTTNLDGKTRLSILNEFPMDDLINPKNTLSRLYTNDNKRSQWQNSIYNALSLHVGIYIIKGGNLSVHFSKNQTVDERTQSDAAVKWVADAQDVNNISDGVRAYSGILAELHASLHKIVLIDEPEAFLHPSLARRLGVEVAQLATNDGRHVFVATHSAEFLMGALLSGARVNVIRLTWDGEQGSARLLEHSQLKELMNHPMLRSVGVFSGLFYKNVVVTEADTDRAFYSEINDRLTRTEDPRAIEHALFLNADNHQTIPHIISPLRKLGISAVGIFDLDAISEGGINWTNKLDACNLPKIEQKTNSDLRDKIYKALECKAPAEITDDEKRKKYFKTHGGINILDASEKEAAESFINNLGRYGLFLVPHGEVEGWLKNLDVPQNKRNWRNEIFQKMGYDPDSIDYIKPSNGDVWDFIKQINDWTKNPKRAGLS